MVLVAVIGAGRLGASIAGELAFRGHSVKIFDRDPEVIANLESTLELHKRQLRQDGILLPGQDFDGDVHYFFSLPDALSNVDYVFEAAVENLELKQSLFKDISTCVADDVIISSSTLSLDITDIASRAIHPERILGLRFLLPVYAIPEVELQMGAQTLPSSVLRVQTFLESMGKILFLREGRVPLRLTPAQVESRKQICREDIVRNRLRRNPRLTLTQYGHVYHTDGSYVPAADHQELVCIVCMDRERDALLCPCNHFCSCQKCAKTLVSQNAGCPVCRGTIEAITPVYSC
ncbi:5-formyl-3-hydroxy-2-methylpyridine 4-carboxylate 5-dehydrogenase-like [Oscarella lobularis]|uniref:5-formyl-3-hydroxy-2-methylpyridine 4-carboxylate 5-dehydrogenase-like n=1 Tax=Oscarella lobularis TaxID=121494 RepID=UPI00331402C7